MKKMSIQSMQQINGGMTCEGAIGQWLLAVFLGDKDDAEYWKKQADFFCGILT